jgi:hypothetical protein
VIKKMGYDWQLRQIMADRGMFQTSDLAGPLAERGINLSREQLWRLVSQPPQRFVGRPGGDVRHPGLRAW